MPQTRLYSQRPQLNGRQAAAIAAACGVGRVPLLSLAGTDVSYARCGGEFAMGKLGNLQ